MIKKEISRILSIETSCDETAAAVIENGDTVLSSVVASQVDLHARYGGVFPEAASRQHILTIYPVVDQALQQAHLSLVDVDGIAVTRGPGLAGSLVVGVNMAKGLALSRNLPIVGVNHLEGHIYSAWISPDGVKKPEDLPAFPLVALLVSGGHTELNLMTGHLTYRRLGGTLDDAAGEAFDKVARLLNLGYPGGPVIQQAALKGNPARVNFPRAWLENTWNFSFSGLKTAVLRTIQEYTGGSVEQRAQANIPVWDLAASFQEAVVEVLYKKTIQAAKTYQVKDIVIAGGVSANQALRKAFLSQSNFRVHIPPLSLCTDNATMIGVAGYYRFLSGQRDSFDFDVLPSWSLS